MKNAILLLLGLALSLPISADPHGLVVSTQFETAVMKHTSRLRGQTYRNGPQICYKLIVDVLSSDTVRVRMPIINGQDCASFQANTDPLLDHKVFLLGVPGRCTAARCRVAMITVVPSLNEPLLLEIMALLGFEKSMREDLTVPFLWGSAGSPDPFMMLPIFSALNYILATAWISDRNGNGFALVGPENLSFPLTILDDESRALKFQFHKTSAAPQK